MRYVEFSMSAGAIEIENLLLTEIIKSLSSIPMVSGLSSNLSFDL